MPGDLFGVSGRSKPVKALPTAAPVDTQRLIGVWASLFERRFGEKPIVTGKDGAAMKRLIGHAGAAAVERRLPIYLALDDAYIAAQGFPLALMLGAWNKLIAQDRPERSRVPDADATEAYLRDLKGRRG